VVEDAVAVSEVDRAIDPGGLIGEQEAGGEVWPRPSSKLDRGRRGVDADKLRDGEVVEEVGRGGPDPAAEVERRGGLEGDLVEAAAEPCQAVGRVPFLGLTGQGQAAIELGAVVLRAGIELGLLEWGVGVFVFDKGSDGVGEVGTRGGYGESGKLGAGQGGVKPEGASV